MNIKYMLKKYNRTLIAIFLMVILIISIYMFLSTKTEATSKNPLKNMNMESSQVLLVGDKYSMNNEKEKEFKEEQKKREEANKEKQIEKEEELTSQSLNNDPSKGKDGESTSGKNKSGGHGDGGNGGSKEGEKGKENTDQENQENNGKENPGEEDKGNKEEEKEKDKEGPPIVTVGNMVDGGVYSGSSKSFTVSAKDWRGTIISSANFDINVNGGERLYSSKTNGNENIRTYRMDSDKGLKDGSNEVTIKVKDGKNRTTILKYRITCNFSEHVKPYGTVTFIIERETIGLGPLLSMRVDMYEGDNISIVVNRAMNASGLSYTSTGSVNYGFYVEKIYKAGITSGASDATIPQPIKEKLVTNNISWMGFKADSLGQNDFYDNSGWIFLQNDKYLDSGTADVAASDGDVIRMAFTVHNGLEYSGKWFPNGW